MGMAFASVERDTSGFVIYAPTSIVSQTCVCFDCRMARERTRIGRSLAVLRDLTEKIKQTDSRGNVPWPGLDSMPEWFDRYRVPAPLEVIPRLVRRVQERFSMVQRRHRKRRRLVQSFAV